MASFISTSLTREEQIINVFSLSWTAWIGFWVLVVLSIPTYGLSLVAAVFVYFQLQGLERAVTSKRVIQKVGFISRKTDEMRLSSIETVEIEQGILGRLADSGTLKVSGKGISDVVMKHINDPMRVKKIIEEAENYDE